MEYYTEGIKPSYRIKKGRVMYMSQPFFYSLHCKIPLV